MSEQHTLCIRPMTEADLPEVLEIERENFAVPWSETSFRAMLLRPEAVFLVAAEEGGAQTLAGYAGAVTACDQGDVTNIAVRGEKKRRGIGARLLESLLNEARNKGVAEMFLEVREHNEPAKHLYSTQGFVPVGVRKGYYADTREDAILMKCTLPSG